MPSAAGASAGGPEEPAPRECISVVARVRPSESPSPCIRLQKQALEVAVPRGGTVNNQIEEYKFQFSNVFGPEATQAEVFQGSARDLVLGALDGVNCTVFAYGQTGSGKTHTICGNHRDRGIIPRALACLFDAIDRRADGVTYSLSMSFIEVYKEVGYDLLSKEFGKTIDKWPVVSVSLLSGEPVLTGAKRVPIGSEEDGLHQYFLGDTHRTVAETPHNLNSSRSHCIFSIFVEASDPVAKTVRTSKVQIVDLAGSERLRPFESGSQSDKELMGQAIAINLSLHWLEGVIHALNKPGGSTVVPYRNSFLTKVLKDALGGNARAVMVATVNPSDPALAETVSTCRFAQRVANVQTYARVNEENDPQLVIAALRQENADLRLALSAAAGGEGAEAAEAAPPSQDDLRRRARAFLEDTGEGTEGGAAVLRVTSVLEALAAFRVLRELFWESLRGRRTTAADSSTGGTDDATGHPAGGAEATTAPGGALATSVRDSSGGLEAARTSGPDAGASAGSGSGARAEEMQELRQALAERDGECRMLRAALAAQPLHRPPAATAAATQRPAKAKVPSFSVATQTEVQPRKQPRPKRPTSADPRPKEMKKFIGFSQEDVVDRFNRSEGPCSLPPLARNVDARVPDFRHLRPSTGTPPPRASSLGASSSSVTSLPPLVPADKGDPLAARDRRQAPSVQSEPMVSSQAAKPLARATPAPVLAPDVGRASQAWLSATTALTADELAKLGDPSEAYKLFLQHDPRAADIWPSELESMQAERRERMEEARRLGEELEHTKEATNRVQAALGGLKRKLQEAEAEAAVDPSAAQRAATLRGLLAQEEPKLVQLFDEKRQRYELDFARLKELRLEVCHIEHGRKKLEATVQAEFAQWQQAVAQRYPDAGARGAARGEASPASGKAALMGDPPAATSAPGPLAAVPSSPSQRQGASTAASGVLAKSPTAAVGAPTCQAAPPTTALAAAEAALASLRQRLREAQESGDERRQAMLQQILAVEEPRLARLRNGEKLLT